MTTHDSWIEGNSFHNLRPLSSHWELRSSRYFFSFLKIILSICSITPLSCFYLFTCPQLYVFFFFFNFGYNVFCQFRPLYCAFLPVVKWSAFYSWFVSGNLVVDLFKFNLILEAIMQLNDYYRNPSWCWIFTSWCAFILSYIVIMKLRIHFSLLSLCDPGSYIIWFFYIPKLVIFHIWLLECTVRCVVDMLVYSYSLPPPCWEGYCIHRWQVETISWNTLSY